LNSKTVSVALRALVRPILKEAGFSKFTDRNSWRILPERIDVVNYQSFNSYNAAALGCTTYSFAVNLGSFLRCIPAAYEPEKNSLDNPKFRPAEYDCHFRGPLRRSIPQPELENRMIWYVDPDGQYLDDVVGNVRLLLSGEGLFWFDRFDDIDEVLRILTNDDENMQHLWGFGRRPSPKRSYMTGYVAKHLNKIPMARDNLQSALESGCYKGIESIIRNDVPGAT
jgi:Domain of unknown function (DUF4304)